MKILPPSCQKSTSGSKLFMSFCLIPCLVNPVRSLIKEIVICQHFIGYLGTFGKNATKKFKDSLSFISQVP
ncbi:hypothetical protein N5U27_10950, partial [Aliarcobacter butzleri]|uniref:hypothetical protein n=1 Tax=Aliarcobacter butzleri TaxID=28197 RepID=UPI0021B58678